MDTAGVLELVQRARAGDRAAWSALFERVLPELVSRRWSQGSISLVLGEVWERGLRGIVHFRGGADDATTAACFCSWMRRIVRSAFSSFASRNGLRRTLPLQPGGTDSSYIPGEVVLVDGTPLPAQVLIADEELAAQTEALHRIKDALELLAEDDRLLLQQSFFDGKANREIARERGVDESLVRYHISRALGRLTDAYIRTRLT